MQLASLAVRPQRSRAPLRGSTEQTFRAQQQYDEQQTERYRIAHVRSDVGY
jgi:hypothetical protein